MPPVTNDHRYRLMLSEDCLSNHILNHFAKDRSNLNVIEATHEDTLKIIERFLKLRLSFSTGHSCFVKLPNGHTKLIIHSSLDEPLTRWPWPLIIIQRHLAFNVVVSESSESGEDIYKKGYPYKCIGEAISEYLRGINSETIIFQD